MQCMSSSSEWIRFLRREKLVAEILPVCVSMSSMMVRGQGLQPHKSQRQCHSSPVSQKSNAVFPASQRLSPPRDLDSTSKQENMAAQAMRVQERDAWISCPSKEASEHLFAVFTACLLACHNCYHRTRTSYRAFRDEIIEPFSQTFDWVLNAAIWNPGYLSTSVPTNYVPW